MVVVAWLHGSIGMFSWMRLRPSWERWSLFIYPLVVLVPVLALVGFVGAGNDVGVSALPDRTAAPPLQLTRVCVHTCVCMHVCACRMQKVGVRVVHAMRVGVHSS